MTQSKGTPGRVPPFIMKHLHGAWIGKKQLFLKPQENPDHESPSTLAIETEPGEATQLRYTWSYKGKDHEGVMLLTADLDSGSASATWGDTFHQRDSDMHLEGTINKQGNVDLLGSYAASPGPDWGWRITLEVSEHGELNLFMYNIWPEGQEDIGVRAVYTKV